jgi:N-acetylmuramoyl-L-alanine amidase
VPPAPTPPPESPVEPPPKIIQQVPAPVTGWVPVQEVSQANGWSAPERFGGGTNLVYQVTTPEGRLVLKIGSRIASWAGVDLWLGFAPQLSNSQPMVHTLDVEKNFTPLTASLTLPAANERVLVIDPGHGGDNLGAKSAFTHHYEKEYTLDWAIRLKPLAEARGWKVFLTRTRDMDVALSNRVEFAEQHHADLFISLHFNSAGATQTGLETYCFTPVGMTSHVTRGYEDPPAVAQPNNAFDLQNLQYAYRFQKAVLAAVPMPDRGVRRARFMGVLRGQNRPAVLIEGGYLSNPEEARLIDKSSHRQKLAEAVANALE